MAMNVGDPNEVTVIVHLHVKAGMQDEFLQLLTPVLDCMRHENTFISAVLHRSPDDATIFMLYEVWADRDDLINVQMKREYRSAYEARLADLLREPRRAEVWQRLRADATFFARPQHHQNLNLR
jgi:quinol monooxygenase YgiN